ncbi:STAS domain-containing protein [Georgenia satyanarayanai]|uniref:STAS domain-containing protein n=1 Tax=Georgenia satyanarayanai TaxID=860221 RepID=UPI002040EBD9|nr:STAS domain-containing protein [Georgenia satyanarayanai]MCM3661536.1 STAS domain-containing protein [Georgenia satyanarayanai]
MSSNTPASGTAAVLFSAARVRLALAGEVDLMCLAEVEEACRDAKSYDLPIDLDVRNITFMDSSVLALIFTLAVASPVRVIGPNELVRFLFDVTGLSTRVEMLDEDPGFLAL